MADNNGDFGAFVTGFLFGGLVGAAVALLMAPQSGEETRELIRVKGIELKEQVEDTAEETIGKVEKAADDARVRAEKFADDARTRAEDLQKRGQVILDEQKSRIENAIESGKKAAKQKRDEISGEA
ncbi:MAG: YtxH domain-containing protein [Anaerolineales bacterium]|nr:YtxH domain-containing protein [Anaerolineales bacterium]